MNPNWLNPQTEKKESILAEIKESNEVEIEEGVGVQEADALVTIMTLMELNEHGFIKTNLDLVTEEGRVIGEMLIKKNYPLDVMSVMMTLMQLFGDQMQENDAMMMTDMVLVAHDNGIEALKKMAEEFEAEEEKGMEGEGESPSDEEEEK